MNFILGCSFIYTAIVFLVWCDDRGGAFILLGCFGGFLVFSGGCILILSSVAPQLIH